MTQNLNGQLTDEEVLTIVNTVVLPKRLNSIQEIVLRLSLSGKTYEEIAMSSAYSIQHIRDVGYQLWQLLSEILDEKVTKKNVQSVVMQRLSELEDLEPKKRVKSSRLKMESLGKTPSNVHEENPKHPGGLIPVNSPLYIERPPLEQRCYEEILIPGALLRIRAPKQMGKTSLMTRILAHASTQGYCTARLNLSQADRAILADSDKFLRWFCVNVSRQLNLEPQVNNYWDEDLGSKVSCTTYFQGYILQQIRRPLVLALDEVDLIFEFPTVAQDFLPLLRFWYEEANNLEIWQNLRQIVVHSTEIYIPLNLNQSPFNVGVPVKLPEFTLEQVIKLAGCYGLNWCRKNPTKNALQLMELVGGHPYLISLALSHLSQENYTLEKLLEEAPTPTGIYGHHLRRHLNAIQENSELKTAIKRVVTASESVDLESIVAYKLDSMGLIKMSQNKIYPSCELYRLYFRQQLD
ncbi:AAA-like domain-containing protein [Capilliphycus salinus ALCB114379]|uniref:AAA-like domain-containing protein n=1 Tax=Capilliphycus salinus TaxID=2768948 RepID=UPI0039A51BBD